MGHFVPEEPMAKGPVTRCLDAISVAADARRQMTDLRGAIAALQPRGYEGLEGVFAQHLLPIVYGNDHEKIRTITEHLKKAWFSLEGWWPSFQPIAPIYAMGVLRTLGASLGVKTAQPLPIDAYWLVGHGQVEMLNLVSSRQVTLLVATPHPVEGAPSGILGESSEVWTSVRRAGRTDNEIDPVSEQQFSGGSSELRVRTFRVGVRERRDRGRP